MTMPNPSYNINNIYMRTYFSLRAKYWLRGGVCGQFPKNLNCSERIG